LTTNNFFPGQIVNRHIGQDSSLVLDT